MYNRMNDLYQFFKIPYISDESAEVIKTYCEMSIIHNYKNRIYDVERNQKK